MNDNPPMTPGEVDWSSYESIREFDRQLDPVPISPVKRIIDVVVSGGLLMLFSPVFLLSWLWVRVSGLISGRRRSLLQRETRVNDSGQFEILKFRVLKPEVLDRAREEEGAVHVKSLEQDPENQSWLGAVLLAVYLDELPQLWNVFVGDMSLVGPRPWPLPDYEGDKKRGFRRKTLIRPGLTGPAQVAKGYPDLYENSYAGDYRYIYNQATKGIIQRLWIDIVMILRTFRVMIKAEGY